MAYLKKCISTLSYLYDLGSFLSIYDLGFSLCLSLSFILSLLLRIYGRFRPCYYHPHSMSFIFSFLSISFCIFLFIVILYCIYFLLYFIILIWFIFVKVEPLRELNLRLLLICQLQRMIARDVQSSYIFTNFLGGGWIWKTYGFKQKRYLYSFEKTT